MPTTVAEIALLIGGEVIGDSSILITGFASAANAQTGELTFAEKASYLAEAEESAASAVLVPEGLESAKKTLIRVENCASNSASARSHSARSNAAGVQLGSSSIAAVML